MNRTAKTVFCAMIIITISVSSAFAEGIMPYADEVFDSITASLYTTGGVAFSCMACMTLNSIKMTDCWLQIKTGNRWSKVCDLEVPTTVAENTFAYSAYMDYSDSIGTGTYRVGFTMNADGHTVTRYSNERTFE